MIWKKIHQVQVTNICFIIISNHTLKRNNLFLPLIVLVQVRVGTAYFVSAYTAYKTSVYVLICKTTV